MEQPLIQTTLGDIKIGRVNQTIPEYISVRCDRKTILGNPYYMHSESDRDYVCERYQYYLPDAYQLRKDVKTEIDRIVAHVLAGHNVLLQCHCAPKQCHTESIRNFILNLINKMPE